MEQRQRSERILQQLRESERVLEVLCPILPIPRKLDQVTVERFINIMEDVSRGAPWDDGQSTVVAGANEFFSKMFAAQTKRYGPALFGTSAFMDGREVFIPDGINDLTFAAILGTPCLGCQAVYLQSEAQWYCSDYRIDGAFFPTSEEKLGILASHFLIQCSQQCHVSTAKAVLKLRAPQTIKGVITTAKAMLEADAQFFHGPQGKRRFIDGKFLESNAVPPHKLFVKKAVVRDREGNLTVGTAYAGYNRFCTEIHARPLTRAEFKDLVKEAIHEEYEVKIRHDVIDQVSGKMTHGWRGLSTRETFQLN